MTWEKLENIAVQGLYCFFLFLSVLIMAECFARWYIDSEELYTDNIQVAMFIHLLPCLYISLIGLWCYYKKFNIGYVCAGILLMYGFQQVIFILRGYSSCGWVLCNAVGSIGRHLF